MALFGENREQDEGKPVGAKPTGTSSPNQVNMVAEGTVFEGTLRTESDVRVSGRIVGKLIAAGRAFVAPEGSIEGEMTAAHADVAGHVKGELNVEERLVLRGSARVEGNIKTGRLIVEEGALFNGECQMGQTGQLRKKPDVPQEVVLPRRVEAVKEVVKEKEPRPSPNDGGDPARAAGNPK